MPFTHLEPRRHSCRKPAMRPDSSPLVYGDIWECDEEVSELYLCGKIYKWSSDQREGDFWMPQQSSNKLKPPAEPREIVHAINGDNKPWCADDADVKVWMNFRQEPTCPNCIKKLTFYGWKP